MKEAIGTETISGLRKSAIVLLSLGEHCITELLSRLPEEDARRVRNEMAQIGSLRSVSLEDRQSVLMHFCAATGAREPQAPQRVDTPFASFHDAEVDRLLDTICDEHPQTIALVLAHLPPKKASAVLAGLPPHKQVEVIKRIAGIKQTSNEVIEQVEYGLRERLAHIVSGAIRGGGVSAVAEILNASERNVKQEILDEVEHESPDLAEQIRKVQAVFEDLLHAPDATILAIIEQLDAPTISLALRTAPERLRQKVLHNLSADDAEQIEEELASLNPVRISEIEEAQQRVAEVVHRLDAAGEIKSLSGLQT